MTPLYLKTGDTIGLLSTAKKVSSTDIEECIAILTEWGLKVVLGKNIFSVSNQFAGADGQRAADLQAMLDDPSVKAILFTRGGYGTVRIIDLLDFSKFIKNPKWLIGFSDITSLHAHVHAQYSIETIHAPMAIHIRENGERRKAAEELKKALFGEKVLHRLNAHPLNRKGKAEGVVTGGNLSLLCSIRGTPSDVATTGKILFLEDLDEYLYHIDRMMMNLKRGGLLDNLAGLVVGGMTAMKDNEIPFGKNAEEIIAEAVENFDYPVCFGFPAGHIEENMPLILGRKASLTVGDDGCCLKFFCTLLP